VLHHCGLPSSLFLPCISHIRRFPDRLWGSPRCTSSQVWSCDCVCIQVIRV
jgi:hypothetical protein